MSSSQETASGNVMPVTAIRHHDSFQATTTGIDREKPGFRLYTKAKRYGTWDPAAIDLSEDARHFAQLTDSEREWLMRITAVFAGGEESVTYDLLPLMMAIASEGRLEEELFLTSFLYDEAKHTEMFRRIIDEVFDGDDDMERFHGPSYRAIFYEALPHDMSRLLVDPSPAAQARAVATYNMIVEGVLAETGHQAYYKALHSRSIMPGICEAMRNIRRDESRHIAYGIYLLSRLGAEDPRTWDAAQERMAELMPHALGVVRELSVNSQDLPFGMRIDDYSDYAAGKFVSRSERVQRGIDSGSLATVDRMANEALDAKHRLDGTTA